MTLSAAQSASRRRMFRRRRAVVLLGLIVFIVLALMLGSRVASAAAAAEVSQELDALVAGAESALAVDSPLVSPEASIALSAAVDSAAATRSNDEETAATREAMRAAVASFTTAAVDGLEDVLGTRSDAEHTTEQALHATIAPLQKATPVELSAALQEMTDAAASVTASSQAYRDANIAASTSDQPVDGSVDAQLEYLLAHATSYNTEEWGDYNSAGGDCVNFTSQGLLARGWQMDDQWSSGGAWEASKAWRSTTAIDEYLTAQGFAVSTFDDLDRVRIGDVGVFDWGTSGVGLDHTMTVSKVEYSDDGPIISFVSHNRDGQYVPMPATLSEKDSGSTTRIYSIP